MTLYDMDEITLRDIGEEVDSEQRAELGPELRAYYNEAYYDLCVNQIRLHKWEQATLGDGNMLDVSALSETVVQIEKVATLPEYEQGSVILPYVRKDINSYIVPSANGSTIWVRYRYAPAPMDTTLETETPALLPERYHASLCLYAAAMHYTTQRKYASAQQWMQLYYQSIANLQPQTDSWGMSARNKYPSRPGVI